MTIKKYAFFILFVSLLLSLCSKSANTLEEQRKRAGIKPPAEQAGSNALITFLELGSVNCVPCRMMQPVMKEIDSIYAGKVKVVFVDVMTAEGKPAIKQYGIQAIPTQIFLDAQGNELARHTGFYPKDSIVALLTAKGIQ